MAHYTVEDVYTLPSDIKRRALLIQVAFEAFDTLQEVLVELREIKKELRDVQLYRAGLERSVGDTGLLGNDFPIQRTYVSNEHKKRGRGRPRKSELLP